jgi:hypothetical protein
MARATVERKHLLPVLLAGLFSFVAMGFLVQAGRSAVYAGAGLVAVAFAVTLVLIVLRRRKNARMMQDILDER